MSACPLSQVIDILGIMVRQVAKDHPSWVAEDTHTVGGTERGSPEGRKLIAWGNPQLT